MQLGSLFFGQRNPQAGYKGLNSHGDGEILAGIQLFRHGQFWSEAGFS